MELREQIARAIHSRHNKPLDSWGNWLPEADAVLEVLRQQKPVFWGPQMAINYGWDSVAVRAEPVRETDIPLYAAPGAQSADMQALTDALELCRFALEPYDDVKPRDWKTDRERLRAAHGLACDALAKFAPNTEAK